MPLLGILLAVGVVALVLARDVSTNASAAPPGAAVTKLRTGERYAMTWVAADWQKPEAPPATPTIPSLQKELDEWKPGAIQIVDMAFKIRDEGSGVFTLWITTTFDALSSVDLSSDASTPTAFTQSGTTITDLGPSPQR